jgi:CheY-like chemotaxis protein
MLHHHPGPVSGVRRILAPVLLVDPDPLTRRLIRTALLADGYSVVAVRCGVDAIDMVTRDPRFTQPWRLAVVFLRDDDDVSVGVACRLVTDERRGPVIAVTNGSTGWLRQRAASIGATATCGPPFDLDALRALVSELSLPVAADLSAWGAEGA